jgi:hypothetical protein
MPEPRLLLIGAGWFREALCGQLRQELPSWKIAETANAAATGYGEADLICWLLTERIEADLLLHELISLRERLGQIPLLLLLPPGHGYSRNWMLRLPAEGLMEQMNTAEICESLSVLQAGGRVVQLAAEAQAQPPTNKAEPASSGLAQWLLNSGVHQIELEEQALQELLSHCSPRGLQRLLLEGRLREMAMARQVLQLLWGRQSNVHSYQGMASRQRSTQEGQSVSIVLQGRSGLAVLHSLEDRLASSIRDLDPEQSLPLLALEALNTNRRRDLLEALLAEFQQLVEQLSKATATGESQATESCWLAQQPLLRQRALQALVGAYTQLPLKGNLVLLGEELTTRADLLSEDPELADLLPTLIALLEGRPLLIEGRLQAPDEPFALLHIQQLMSNWLVRNAELIARQLLESCSGWPELRRAMLQPQLLSTRALERLRNRINALERWQILFERPVAIYESRRLLYNLSAGGLQSNIHLEPRDSELQQLSWWQQSITLLLEARDALAPQLEVLINRIGSLIVLLLTRVLGRAIGLVGRGIVQGMGRGLQNAPINGERS